MKLFFASQNQGKVKEALEILNDCSFSLCSLCDFPELSKTQVEETGSSFKDNAYLKAKFFALQTGILTVADDSGLVVNALDQFPGIHSNRWLKGSDDNRNQGLLKKLKGKTDRLAAFITVACLFDPVDQTHHFFQGKVEGEIAQESKGDAGFGYDPLFIPKGYSQTFGELGLKVKNKLSHRSRALEKLCLYLKRNEVE